MNEIILTSSALILFVAALRRLFRRKISPSLQYALWLLVALRLLIPGTLFSAPVTIVGFAEDVWSVLEDTPTENESTASQTVSPIYIPGQTITITPAPAPATQPGTTDSFPHPAPQISTAPEQQTGPIRQADWSDVIWKAGIAVIGTAFLVSNSVFYCKLRRSRKRMEATALPTTCPIPVYYVKNLASPCLFGRSIYVNEAAMQPERLRHVLIHELTHRRHGDRIWALVRCVCIAIHWYNPLVWWAAILSRRDCELSCDSAVLRRLGDASRISYGETLMAMLTTSPANLLHTATTMSASKRTMSERLKLILHRPRMMKLTLAAVALIVTGAVILTFGGCAEKADDPEPDPAVTVPDDTDSKEDTNPPDDETDTLVPPDGGFGYIPSPTYAHPSGLFTMKLPTDCPVITIESEDGVRFYDAEIYQSGSEDGWILSVHPQPADWTSNQNPTLTLSVFDPNGTQQVYILEYSETYSEQFVNLRDWITGSFTPLATAKQFSRLIHDNVGGNIALVVSYLPYLNWRNYRELYGEDAMMTLLGALWQFADSGSATWDQYHDMLSMTNEGLDGAYSEGLASIFEALFLKNQEQFLSVINSVFITDAERARVAAYVKYGLGSEPDEGDSEDVNFNDREIMMGLYRAYGPTVFSEGSPEGLTLTLTGDWTLEGIKAALFAAVSEHIAGSLLKDDLYHIEIAYSFRFPDEMRDGVILTVPFHAIYKDQDAYILPSGAEFYRGGRTNELTATILLVGEGITAPVDEDFAHGQAIYDLLKQSTVIEDGLFVSLSESNFQLLDSISAIIDQKIIDAGLGEVCRTSSMSCGGYYNPIWCDPGYEQLVEYSVTLLYTEGDIQYQYTFRNTVTLTTTE